MAPPPPIPCPSGGFWSEHPLSEPPQNHPRNSVFGLRLQGMLMKPWLPPSKSPLLPTVVRTCTSGALTDISDEKWLKHFFKVFDVNSVEQDSDANTCSLHTLEINRNSCTKDDFLNSDISLKEVTETIHLLKANKAVGPDGIIPEVYKHAGDKIIPFLVYSFNTIFTSGEYPEAWTEAIILPLYKKGSIHDPDNYRGISLLNVCSKLYSHIIDKRLSK